MLRYTTIPIHYVTDTVVPDTENTEMVQQHNEEVYETAIRNHRTMEYKQMTMVSRWCGNKDHEQNLKSAKLKKCTRRKDGSAWKMSHCLRISASSNKC